IVQSVASDFFVGVGPLGVNWIGEGGAGTRDVGSVGRNERGGGDEAGSCQCGPVFHRFSPCLRSRTSAGRNGPPILMSSRPIVWTPAVALKTLSTMASDVFWFVLGLRKSEVGICHRRRLSLLYKHLVTVP